MDLDWDALLGSDPDRPWSLVANLPYNIATPLLLDPLRDVPQIERMFVRAQLEVAERLAGTPGSRAYGIPSVKVAWWPDPHVVGNVPPTVFIPPPRADPGPVALVRPPPAGGVAERQAVFALTR